MKTHKARWGHVPGVSILKERRKDAPTLATIQQRGLLEYAWSAGGASGASSSRYAAQRAVRRALADKTTE